MDNERKYQPRLKLFGERAARISRSELPEVVQEILRTVHGAWEKVSPVEQLLDKDSFGDLDVIYQSAEQPQKIFFEELLSGSLLEYHRNGMVTSILWQLANQRSIQVDFIWAEDDQAYERKLHYYSKGHLSAMVGMISKPLNFKYGTEGFFKRYQDSKSIWHDVLISPSLATGLQILGFDLSKYAAVQTMEDMIAFVADSKYFKPEYFDPDNVLRRDKQQINLNANQNYLTAQLRSRPRADTALAENDVWQQLFPEQFQSYIQKTTEIETQLRQKKAIDGQLIMQTFSIQPGPLVGKVTKYLQQNYPDATELTPSLVAEINEFLKT